MRTDLTKRVLTFCTFFICCGALALLSASFATQRWIVAKAVKVGLPPSISNATAGDSTKFRGELHFGLFEGSKTLNHGFGDRKSHIWVQQEMAKNPQLFIFSLWLLTIMSLALAMLFALISAVFAVINTVVTPVEVITGIAGLYLWNGVGALFSAGSVLSWVAQYYAKLRMNVMTKEELEQQWTSEDTAWFGYSFCCKMSEKKGEGRFLIRIGQILISNFSGENSSYYIYNALPTCTTQIDWNFLKTHPEKLGNFILLFERQPCKLYIYIFNLSICKF